MHDRWTKIPGFRLAQAVRHVLMGGERRNAALLRLSKPSLLFQPFGDTAPDRYPEIFAALASGLSDRAAVRLFSFGCSIGDEVFSLLHYFPEASIRGVDISARRIALCHSRLEVLGPDQRGRISFDVGVSAKEEPAEAYDAVLAMAVFRHGDLVDGRERNDLIAFSDFENVVASLASCVRPGGYLALRHSNFRFADTAIASDFETVLSQPNITPLYDRQCRRLPHAQMEPCLFRKVGAPTV